MIDFIGSLPIIGTPLVSILPFLFIITIVVFVHEYGHYIIGKFCGIHAEIFSVGMGPTIISRKDKHGTIWQIAAIPLGGYVKFLGDTNASSLPEGEIAHPHSFNSASLRSKTLTVLAGPIANFILSFFIFMLLALWHGKQSNEPIIGTIHPEFSKNYDIQSGDIIVSINDRKISKFTDIYSFIYDDNTFQHANYIINRNGVFIATIGPFPTVPIIGSVMPVSPASNAGLKSGDLITRFNDQSISSFKQLQKIIVESDIKKQRIDVLRNGEIIKLSITPMLRELQNANGEIEEKVSIGVSSSLAISPFTSSVSFKESVIHGLQKTYLVLTQSIMQISKIIVGDIGFENLQGPVGIAHVSSDIAKSDISYFIPLIAIISTSIGFLNLLPIPILDGGHLVMFAYEGITKRKPNQKYINYSAIIALSALLTLMLFVSVNDISRILLFWN
ncbi:RIP metalloprotease RseP [Amylibacter sp.]|nr:RIP metalloprotease RseP [Amylibacter sp.]